jgi:uncharacterized protein (DUF983 family)
LSNHANENTRDNETLYHERKRSLRIDSPQSSSAKGAMTASSKESSSQCIEHPTRRDLPASGFARLLRLLQRAILLRCPLCGSRGIFKSPWSLVDCCPKCGYRFVREEGYFLGAYALNLIVAEVLGLGTILIFLLRSDLSVFYQQAIAVAAAITLPIVFFPFSRTLWMTIDLMIHPNLEERQVSVDRMR